MMRFPRKIRRRYDILLSIIISMIVTVAALGGFLIGRGVTRDAFLDKISREPAVARGTLLSAGQTPLTLFQVTEDRLDDPLARSALASMYGVPPGDREALVKRLREVIWVPPYRPAPFVGHIARPFFGSDLRINFLGFRDKRQTYVTKPEKTVRVFITGGSTAWGTGASSQRNTISYLLEQILNERMSPATGLQYEVINAAFPAWSTTQEKLLIQQRLVDMHPDAVIMFSGNNDVHWSLQDSDIRWFYTYMDLNYVKLLNEIYQSSGHSEWRFSPPFSSGRIECSSVAEITARNVRDAAAAARGAGARLIFALQPNIVSTAKQLTVYEQRIRDMQAKPYWDACYQSLRETLARTHDYQTLDLSRSFGDLGDNVELFIDGYHFADEGNRRIAQALAEQIDWSTITPHGVVAAAGEPLTIAKLDPAEAIAGKPFNAQPDETPVIRITPSRINKNLVVVFDETILPTLVAEDSITAALALPLYAAKGKHDVSIVDAVTGQTSLSVPFTTR